MIQHLEQRFLALSVQAGVRLVEDQEPHITQKGARKADPLSLAGGKHKTGVAKLGLIALREPKDHVVHVGQLGRGHHLHQ